MSPTTSPTRAQLLPENSYSSTASELTAVDTSLVGTKGVQPLPKGAAGPVPSLSFQHSNHNVKIPDTPPATPSQRLLDSDQSHVQFATYNQEQEEKPSSPRRRVVPGPSEEVEKPWVPLPLRPIFWVPFVLLLVAIALGLEVAFHFNKKNQGWATKSDFTEAANVLHYVYTLPPVIIVAIFVALWTWTDIEIKKMQPYVDLVDGDSPPKRSLLLDYTRSSNAFVWIHASRNQHWMVFVTTVMVLLSLTFQPLASSLFQVRDTWLPAPDLTLNNLRAIGLNQDTQFSDLTSFLTAAGYASASVLYNLPDASFIHGQYTVAPFELPTDIVVNSTVLFANTTAIKSEPGCLPVNVEKSSNTDGSWTNSATTDGCSLTWVVDNSTTTLFGTNISTCTGGRLEQFTPVVFWFFTYEPTAKSSATFCFPTISLWDVNIQFDLASQNVTAVTELQQLSMASSPFAEFSGNVTGDPLDGRAYNGIRFNLTNPDEFVLQRQSAIQLQLPAAVFQAARQSPGGIQGAFDQNQFVGLSNQVYTTYLALIARNVYFLETTQRNTIQVKAVQKRLFLSPFSTHILTAFMLILAFCATFVQLIHRIRRRGLRLRHEPGTIASAVSIGGQTGMVELLAGHQNSKEMYQALHDKKFRIDPDSMKIVMEGEEGYEWAQSPMDRRRSVFGALQSNRFSRRLSKASQLPGSPKSPKSPKPHSPATPKSLSAQTP